MKSSLVGVTEEIKRSLPALYRNPSNNSVVLFSSPKTGTVVFKGDGDFHVGYHSQAWVECYESWTRLKEGCKVILEQE